jgi:tetratricopeptide (TPR) repeat protein
MWPYRAVRGAVAAFRLFKQLQADADARICLGFKRQQEILSEQLSEAQARGDVGEEGRVHQLLHRVQDDELSYHHSRMAQLARHVIETRAPPGMMTIDLPKLPEPEREGLDTAATALKALAPAETFADHFLRGNAFYGAGDFQNALEEYDAALELRPDDPDTLNNRAGTLYNLDRYEEALADCNGALKLRPDDPAVLNGRGIALGHLGRYEEALADYNRALEVQPGDPHTPYNRACLFSLMQRWSEALLDLAAGIRMDAKYRGMAREDEDFEALRNDPEWGPKFWEIVGTGDQP